MDTSDYPTNPAERDLYNWAIYGERVVLIEVEKDPTQVIQITVLVGTIINPVYTSNPKRKVLVRLDELGKTASITTEDPLNQIRDLDDPHMLRVGEVHLLCNKTICETWFREIYKDTPSDPDPRIIFGNINRALLSKRFDRPLMFII